MKPEDLEKMSELERAIYHDWQVVWDKNRELTAELSRLQTENENLRNIVRKFGELWPGGAK